MNIIERNNEEGIIQQENRPFAIIILTSMQRYIITFLDFIVVS